MLPHDVDDALKLVHQYAPELREWIEIKKQVIKLLSPASRTLFSRRHPVTKLQMTNDFELTVAEKWADLTGESVVFTKQHEQK